MKTETLFTKKNNLLFYTAWEENNTIAVFSTKDGGNSRDNYASFNLALHVGDDANAVIKNREQFARELNLDLNKFSYQQQTHSANATEITSDLVGIGSLSNDDAIIDNDALYTFLNDVALNVFVADCTPVFFRSVKDNLIGVIHAGWQGTVKSITYKTISQIVKKHQLDISNIEVLIGPNIAYENFEVGHDVIDLINNINNIDVADTYKTHPTNSDKYLADVRYINYKQVLATGVLPENIKVTNLDTYSDPQFFSYRKNNKTGRMSATIIQRSN